MSLSSRLAEEPVAAIGISANRTVLNLKKNISLPDKIVKYNTLI